MTKRGGVVDHKLGGGVGGAQTTTRADEKEWCRMAVANKRADDTGSKDDNGEGGEQKDRSENDHKMGGAQTTKRDG